MNQLRLPGMKPARHTKSLHSVATSHDENNLRTAREILANPDAWGGEGLGMVDWAHRVVERVIPAASNHTSERTHP